MYNYPFDPREVQNSQPTHLEAAPGFKFITVKFVALLTCIIAWLAEEQWRIEALADNGQDIYTILASKMSEAYTVSSDVNLRDIVENVDLGLCFGDISRSDLVEQGIDSTTTHEFKWAWEEANPAISGLIKHLGMFASHDPLAGFWHHPGLFLFSQNADDLCIQLRSGRVLWFRTTESDVDDFNDPYLIYYRYSPEEKSYRSARAGELLKMIATELAVDLLNSFMLSVLTRTNYRIVSNRYNEIVLEVPDYVSIDAVKELTTDLPDWAYQIPLRTEVSECTLIPGNDQQGHPKG